MTINVTDNTFQTEVLEAKGPVLVDFWAEWCGPCRAIAPVLEELQKDFGDALTIAKVNVDESPQSAQRFGIRSIPTLLLFVGGVPVETVIGAQPKAAIEAVVNRHLPAAA